MKEKKKNVFHNNSDDVTHEVVVMLLLCEESNKCDVGYFFVVMFRYNFFVGDDLSHFNCESNEIIFIIIIIIGIIKMFSS